MQKRDSFHISIKKLDLTIWTPAPRECATITEVNGFAYVVGGMNHDVIKDISRLKLKVPYTISPQVCFSGYHLMVEQRKIQVRFHHF